MIDTYFDRADAATGYEPTAGVQPMHEDPRWYAGQLYSTMIDRDVAIAKNRLTWFIEARVIHHKAMMWRDAKRKAAK